MAVEADRVVVELVAQTQGFDTQLKQSGQNFASTMSDVTRASKGVEAAANDVYTAHNKMGIATNNARIAQMELEHVVRGSIDSYASGGNAVQIFAQHIASVAEAATFMGGSLGSVGAILSGPWGIAITAGVAILATLISRHKEEADSVETLVEKLKKNHDHTQLQNEADAQWSNTIDGLIDKLTKLNDVTAKRLSLPNIVNRQAFTDAQGEVDRLNRAIDKAEADPKSNPARIDALYKALSVAVTNLRLQTTVLGTQVGEVFSDLTKKADDWAQYQQNKIRFITGTHPELAAFTAQIDAAFGDVKKAISDAATAKVPFDAVTSQIDGLNNKLAESPSFIKDYISNLRQMAVQLEHTVEVAKNAPKAIADFQRAVIGAEGTGANRLGSSAAGFGQFMPKTFEGYFKQLYPQEASGLTNSEIDAFRNNKDVATAVIDAATKDYVAVIKAAGQQITAASLYTVHLLGAGDAAKLFAASGDQSVSSALGGGRHAAAVIAGNPFLGGTVADARNSIAQRIGDSDSSVSSGAVAIQREITSEAEKQTKELDKLMSKEAEVTVSKGNQSLFAEEILGHTATLQQLVERGILPSLKSWQQEYKEIIASQEELNRFGNEMVDEILNPDNWTSWGDMGKRILHELEIEIIKLAALNPLKNLLNGPSGPQLPTLLGTLTSLFGGGGGGGIVDPGAGNLAALNALGAGVPHFAGGGVLDIGGNGGTDSQLLSIGGQARAMVSPNEKLAIIPSNATAAAAGGGGSTITLRVIKGDLFDIIVDGRASRVAAPMVAQGSIAAAQGGATISRRNLGRESMHRLE